MTLKKGFGEQVTNDFQSSNFLRLKHKESLEAPPSSSCFLLTSIQLESWGDKGTMLEWQDDTGTIPCYF